MLKWPTRDSKGAWKRNQHTEIRRHDDKGLFSLFHLPRLYYHDHLELSSRSQHFCFYT